MNTEEMKAQAELFAKLARVAAEIGNLEKTGTNTHFNYKFVEENAVSDTVRKLLSREGIAFFASMDHAEMNEYRTPNNKGGETITTHAVCTFTFTFADGETGATFACRWHGEAKDQQDKAINKAATAALKYFLLKNFMISTGKRKDDPDTDSRLDRSQRQERQQHPNAQPKQQSAPQTSPKPNNPPQQTGGSSVLETGFSVETARNFLGWAKRNYGIDEDGVRKVLDTMTGHELAGMTQFPGTILDAVTYLMVLEAEHNGKTIALTLETIKEGRSKFIAPHGKPFTLAELDMIAAKAKELAK